LNEWVVKEKLGNNWDFGVPITVSEKTLFKLSKLICAYFILLGILLSNIVDEKQILK
jgi:hypothetical protein